MAAKTPKPAKPARKAASPAKPGTTVNQPATAESPEAEARRLLHAAAWTRMFGRVGGQKNPFSR